MSQLQPAAPTRRPLVCLDFDGVIHAYTSGWQGATVIPDGCVPGFFEFLREISPRARIAIYSARSETAGGRVAMQQAVVSWFRDYTGQRQPQPTGELWRAVYDLEWPTYKPPARVTLDDRCVRFTGRWPAVDDLLGFRTWQQSPPESPAPASSPAAWRVKDFADGWVLHADLDDAWRDAAPAGNLVQPLYASPPTDGACSFVQHRAPDGSWHCQSRETGRVVETKRVTPFVGVPLYRVEGTESRS